MANVNLFEIALKVVKAREKFKKIVKPVEFGVSTEKGFLDSLARPSGDIAFKACTNDVVKNIYALSRLMRLKLIPPEWKDHKGMREWMLGLGKQVWKSNFNAETSSEEWGPVRADGEAMQEYQNRRGRAARNCLSEVRDIIQFLWNAQELFQGFQMPHALAETIGRTEAIKGGSPGIACRDLIIKMVKEAKQAEGEVVKVLEGLSGVQDRLNEIDQDAEGRWKQLMNSKDKRSTTQKLRN